MWTQTAYITPRQVACEGAKSAATRAADCSPGVLAAVDCATPCAEQAAQAMVSPCEAVKTAGGGVPASGCSTEEGSSLQR